MSEEAGDRRILALEAKTRALEMIVMRLVAHWVSDSEEPRREAYRLIEQLTAGLESGNAGLVAPYLRRFGAELDDRLSRKADSL